MRKNKTELKVISDELEELEGEVVKLQPVKSDKTRNVDEEVDLADLFLEDESEHEEDLGVLVDDLLKDEDEHGLSAVEDESVERALRSNDSSHASVYRMRMADPTAKDLEPVELNIKGAEDVWEEAPVEKIGGNHFRGLLWLLIALVVGGAIWAIVVSTDPEAENQEKIADLRDKDATQKEKIRQLQEEMSSVETVMRRYMAAQTPEERLPYLKGDETVRAYYLEYYQKNPDAFKKYEGVVVKSIYKPTTCYDVWFGLVSYEHARKLKNYDRIIVQPYADDEKGFYVDVEAMIEPDPAIWKRFIAEKPTEPQLLRAEVFCLYDGGAFLWGFSDEEYDCCQVRYTGTESAYWGYVKKGSKLSRWLKHWYENARYVDAENWKRKTSRLVIMAKFPENTPAENYSCFEIVDVVSSTWGLPIASDDYKSVIEQKLLKNLIEEMEAEDAEPKTEKEEDLEKVI